MIRIKLKAALDNAASRAGHAVTLADLERATGLSRTTIKRMANLPGHNAELDAIDALCKYFKCQPGELLEYVPDGRIKITKRRY